MNRDVEWLCYHLVAEGILSAENCQVVADAIVEAGIEDDAATFVQVMIDNELTDDVATLNQLMDMAVQEARTLGFPPKSVFDDDAEASPEPEAEDVAKSTSRRRAHVEADAEELDDLPAIPTAAPPPKGEDWLYGWPDLSQAEHMTTDAARDLLGDFLHRAKQADCSDVHITAGSYPFVRCHKSITLLPDQKMVSRETARKLNLSPLSEEDLGTFNTTHDLDYCLAMTEDDRYRTNILRQRLGVSGSYRIIESRIRSLKELGFPKPEVLEKLTTYHQGLILLTGPVGSGKSCTLASLVDLLNKTRQDHIVCVEDPIEVVFHPLNCNITQRELGSHTRSFSNALRGALREDPDIIVIGELRDLDTIEMAVRAAETGHLVFGTLHTSSAASTMDRILDVFPPNQMAQIRSMAAESLKAVVCQQLLRNHDGSGVVLASEILLATLAVSNLIREGKTFQLDSIIQTSRNLGMSTMEQSYVDLFLAGQRSYEQTLPLLKSDELIRQVQAHAAKQMGGGGGGEKKRKWF